MNGLIMGLPLRVLIKKAVYWAETYQLSDRENVLGAAVIYEGHDDSLLGHERTYYLCFPRKKVQCKLYILLSTP